MNEYVSYKDGITFTKYKIMKEKMANCRNFLSITLLKRFCRWWNNLYIAHKSERSLIWLSFKKLLEMSSFNVWKLMDWREHSRKEEKLITPPWGFIWRFNAIYLTGKTLFETRNTFETVKTICKYIE